MQLQPVITYVATCKYSISGVVAFCYASFSLRHPRQSSFEYMPITVAAASAGAL